jgi:thiamine-phosphate diphosphorylase
MPVHDAHRTEERAGNAGWLQALRVLLVTDGQGDLARLLSLCRSALAGGVRAVQLREPRLSARQLATMCERLLPLLDAQRGLLLVNDRVDVVAAGLAHGAHVGHRSLLPVRARQALQPGQLLGASVHDDRDVAQAAAAGCDFVVLAPVWPTPAKPDAMPLGLHRAGPWTAASKLPVVWLGGVAAEHAAQVAALPYEQRPRGVAVRSAICSADDPEAAARALVAAWAGAVAQ